MPAIAARRDGGFLLLGKFGGGKVLVQSGFPSRPELLTREGLRIARHAWALLSKRLS